MDITGQRYGRLTVESRADTRNNCIRWNCICDCGNRVVVYGHNLRQGNTTSCGCYRKESRAMPRKYAESGYINEHLYFVWAAAKSRCYSTTSPKWKWYGKRGIKVCEEWKDYAAFREWSLSNGYEQGLTLDRIDNDGDYTPDNCRWVTMKVQANNRSNNKSRRINNGQDFTGT